MKDKNFEMSQKNQICVKIVVCEPVTTKEDYFIYNHRGMSSHNVRKIEIKQPLS